MKILVVGAGALGSVIATKLTRAGVHTVALDTNDAHVDICRSPGVRVDLPDGTSLITPLTMATRVEELDTVFDYALITLKAPAVPPTLRALTERNLVKSYVSLGNGLIQDVIANIVGEDHLLVGTVSWGATFQGVGHVRQTTSAPFAVGDLHPDADPHRLRDLVDVLSNVAPAHTTDNVTGQVWAKLLLNSSLSGLGTVAGTDYASVIDDPRGAVLALGLWTEGLRVAEAIGMPLDSVAGIDPYDLDLERSDAPERAFAALDVLKGSLGATKASMLQDLGRGVPTEVDVINGAVARVGAEHDVPCPLNQRCAEIIRACENGSVHPGPSNLGRFDDLLIDRAFTDFARTRQDQEREGVAHAQA